MQRTTLMNRLNPARSEDANRREFLWNLGGGLGGIALSAMLQTDPVAAADVADQPAAGRSETAAPANRSKSAGPQPHFAPKAKRVVQFFMAGGASHIDLWDHKPLLTQKHGEPWNPGEAVELFQSTPGACFGSPWAFKPYGESGRMLSDIVSPLGAVADELAFVHSVVGKTGVHSQGTLLQSTGFNTPGFPGMGCWVSYGLGSLNENLPTFVVLPDLRGFPSNGAKNWDSAFLPAEHQGTLVRVGAETPIEFLQPPANVGDVSPGSGSAVMQTLQRLNGIHAHSRQADSRLAARIRSYELAAKMQLAAPEALDLHGEPEYIFREYGIRQTGGPWPTEINVPEETDIMGRKCLTARRMLERGVRFVQIWSGCDNGFPRRNWDSHEDIARDHGPLAAGMAGPIAAFIADLKRRGMLDDTLVLWTTEFGRMPCSQGSLGRDHNPFVFTNWLAGGGIRGGATYGTSDEWGYKPASQPTNVYDIHATVLHLLGIDHKRLTWRHSGIDRRLTDVHGHVLQDLIA